MRWSAQPQSAKYLLSVFSIILYLAQPAMNRSFLVPAFRAVLLFLRCLSLHSLGRATIVSLLRRRTPRLEIAPYEPRLWNEFYVTAAIAFSACNLWVFVPQTLLNDTNWKALTLGAVLPIYRVAEILRTASSVIFVDREERFHIEIEPNTGNYYTLVGNLNSWLLMIVIKFFDLILCFSSLALFLKDEWNRAVAGPLDALYTTMVTMLTLGYGDFHPSSDRTKMLVIAELVCFIAYGLLVIPIVASSFKTRELKRIDQ